MQEYDLYISRQWASTCVRGQVSRIWPILANGYLMAMRRKSNCRLTLCGASKLRVTPSGTWVEF